jgi:hypothetical protein
LRKAFGGELNVGGDLQQVPRLHRTADEQEEQQRDEQEIQHRAEREPVRERRGGRETECETEKRRENPRKNDQERRPRRVDDELQEENVLCVNPSQAVAED